MVFCKKRQRVDFSPGHQDTEAVNWIAGIGNQGDIARIHISHGQMGQSILGAH